MAEEFQAGICSGSWWNTLRTPTFDYGPAISCPSAITGSIGDDSPGSGSSITFQDTLKMDSTPQVFGLSDWNQPFLPYYQQEGAIEVQPERTQLGFRDSSESLAQEQNQQNCLGLPSAVLQGLLEPVDPFPQFLRAGVAASPKQQLHFSNNTPFWNPSATPVPNQITMQSFQERPSCSTLTPKRNCERSTRDLSSRLTNKPSIGKNNVSEPAVKKPRIETPSPLPTFKVRKEKVGDRITALQQLVSPFGKTDTASVLHEAIDYIKFLHNQVGSLCNPYLKYNGHQVQQQRSKEDDEPNEDLRSRGLCLVPISSTFAVASEMPLECWNPTFGGSYR